MASEFEKMRRKAVKHGWAVPPDIRSFSDDVWIGYWKGMANYRAGRSEGRPIPPHRSGGS